MTRDEALKAARNLPRSKRNVAAEKWNDIADVYCGAVAALPKRKRLKSFEVHHTLQRAREAYLVALVNGKDWDACAADAMAFMVLK